MIYFVAGIHTNAGKTVVSAILTKALQGDYWKPVQTGEDWDSEKVEYLINNNHSLIYDEAYSFKTPVSPHAAAKAENTVIDLDKILLPEQTGTDLIIEGAGGILTPLNDQHFIIDIAAKFNAQIILVSNNYLGSINHTILTINEIKRRNLPVRGIIFNGEENTETEEFITRYSKYKCLLKIRPEKEINEEIISKYAIKLFEAWHETI